MKNKIVKTEDSMLIILIGLAAALGVLLGFMIAIGLTYLIF